MVLWTLVWAGPVETRSEGQPGELPAGPVIWLEAEHFRHYGGWTLDSQFIDSMGSSYLLAIGLGTPVPDAVTTITPPSPGRYRLWVRTKDWVPEHHPGRFEILVGGQAVEHEFGQSGRSGWLWEDGGWVDLSRPTEVRLRDGTGYYGRCDVMVFVADPHWCPPQEKQAIAKLRTHYGGLHAQVEDKGPYDVVVVGGGLAGCMAAVSAARLGCRTVLIQNRPVLGGNASVEILVPPVGIWPHSGLDSLCPRETGLIGEIRTEGNQRSDEAKVYSARLLRLVQAEPNLDLFVNTHAIGVEMESAGDFGSPGSGPQSSRRIAAVEGVNVRTGDRFRFIGQVFIDCTGDASIGAAAGAEFRHGKEPRSMYGESLAPEEASPHTMGNSLKYVTQSMETTQRFDTPPWAYPFRKPEDIPPGRYPRVGANLEWQWVLELGGTRNTIDDAEEIRDDLLRLIYGLWGYVKNYSPTLKEKAAQHKLIWVGHVAGKRESRRLIGDYVLTQNDISQQTLFADRIAFSGWGVDDHHSEGFFYPKWPASAMPDHMFAHGLIHAVPFRCLYSRNVENLMMAGRNISASHVAMASTRVMLTCAVIGQAAGTGAALSVQHQCSPRQVGQKHLEQLQQQLLKDGAYLIEMPNRDPRDLARSARATASSERRRENDELMAAGNVINGLARAENGRTNAWAPSRKEPLPQWIELAWSEPKTLNVVHVTFQTKHHTPDRFAVQAWTQGAWETLAEVGPCNHQRYVLGLKTTRSERLRVVLLEVSRPEVGICEIRVYHEPDRVVEIARRALANVQQPDGPLGLPWDDSRDEPLGIDPKKLPGRVVDDSQAEPWGHWHSSTWGDRFIGSGYAHDGNTQKGQKQLRFLLRAPEKGDYEVRLAYVATTNRASNALVTVHRAGETHPVRINQKQPPPLEGLWYPLGRFSLQAGQTLSVVVSNSETDGYVVADAVQLLRLPGAETASPPSETPASLPRAGKTRD